jgi:hypothetical protein
VLSLFPIPPVAQTDEGQPPTPGATVLGAFTRLSSSLGVACASREQPLCLSRARALSRSPPQSPCVSCCARFGDADAPGSCIVGDRDGGRQDSESGATGQCPGAVVSKQHMPRGFDSAA